MAGLDGQSSYGCRSCRTPLAKRQDLLSKNYKAKSGEAYLFSHVMNIVVGEKEDRQLITGRFTIAGIYCKICGEELGWMYVKAYEPRQQFKEGRFIVETAKILKEY